MKINSYNQFDVCGAVGLLQRPRDWCGDAVEEQYAMDDWVGQRSTVCIASKMACDFGAWEANGGWHITSSAARRHETWMNFCSLSSYRYMTYDANTIYIRTAYVWCVAVISGISPQSNSRCGTTSCALRVAINRPCTRPVCNTINRNPNRSHAFYYVFCVNALQKPNMESGGVTRYAHFSRHHEVFGITQASCNRVVFCVCLSVCAFYMFFFLLLLYFIFF